MVEWQQGRLACRNAAPAILNNLLLAILHNPKTLSKLRPVKQIESNRPGIFVVKCIDELIVVHRVVWALSISWCAFINGDTVM